MLFPQLLNMIVCFSRFHDNLFMSNPFLKIFPILWQRHTSPVLYFSQSKRKWYSIMHKQNTLEQCEFINQIINIKNEQFWSKNQPLGYPTLNLMWLWLNIIHVNKMFSVFRSNLLPTDVPPLCYSIVYGLYIVWNDPWYQMLFWGQQRCILTKTSLWIIPLIHFPIDIIN